MFFFVSLPSRPLSSKPLVQRSDLHAAKGKSPLVLSSLSSASELPLLFRASSSPCGRPRAAASRWLSRPSSPRRARIWPSRRRRRRQRPMPRRATRPRGPRPARSPRGSRRSSRPTQTTSPSCEFVLAQRTIEREKREKREGSWAILEDEIAQRAFFFSIQPTTTTERLNLFCLLSHSKNTTARPRSRSRRSPPRTSPRPTTGGPGPSSSRPCATSTSPSTAARAGPTVRERFFFF